MPLLDQEPSDIGHHHRPRRRTCRAFPRSLYVHAQGAYNQPDQDQAALPYDRCGSCRGCHRLLCIVPLLALVDFYMALVVLSSLPSRFDVELGSHVQPCFILKPSSGGINLPLASAIGNSGSGDECDGDMAVKTLWASVTC
jgi:hypothetical protein